jgi:hypothetical protein
MMSIVLGQEAGNGRQTPVLVGFMELRCVDTAIAQNRAQPFKLMLVANR